MPDDKKLPDLVPSEIEAVDDEAANALRVAIHDALQIGDMMRVAGVDGSDEVYEMTAKGLVRWHITQLSQIVLDADDAGGGLTTAQVHTILRQLTNFRFVLEENERHKGGGGHGNTNGPTTG